MKVLDETLLQTSLGDEQILLRLFNRLEALGPAQSAIRDFLQQRGASNRAIYNAELIFEELFTNTVRHGYADPVAHEIEVNIQFLPDRIVMSFKDDAQCFDPTAFKAPDLPESIEKAKIGGLGIMLVRKLASAMHYQRVDGHNILRISMPRP